MQTNTTPITVRKRIALVAHDNKKQDLLEWARYNRDLLVQHDLCATGTTGMLVELALDTKVEKLRSGPLGGDQQIGAKIAEGEIDFILKCVAPDLSSFQSFLTEELLKAGHVANVKTSLVIRCAKDQPGLPFDVLEERLAKNA